MQNYGKANVKVELLNTLPNIANKTVHNFDVSAFAWQQILKSVYFSPLFAENVQDEDSFSVCFPTRLKQYMNNYMTSLYTPPANTTDEMPLILWSVTGVKEGVVKGIIEDLPDGKNAYYDPTPELLLPGTYPTNGSYFGPMWADDARELKAPPNIPAQIHAWSKTLGWTPGTTDASTTLPTLPSIGWILQEEVDDGLWWGIESSNFLSENMPFWVTIDREASPSSATHDTYIILSLGIGSTTDAYDIIISDNRRPRIIDYYNGRAAYDAAAASGQLPPINMREFENDLARLFDSESHIEIGIMTIGGRLIIFFNKTVLVYTRVVKTQGEDNGTIYEAKIAPGDIRIYGTNIKVAINACPMIFAPISIMALPVPTIPPTVTDSGASTPAPIYKNVLANGNIGNNTVSRLPNNTPSAQSIYGVDSRAFQDSVGIDTPSGYGFHKLGTVRFFPASNLNLTEYQGASDFYTLVMEPDPVTVTISGVQTTLQYGGAPYFFRLKGGAIVSSPISTPIPTNVSTDLISVSENHQAPDYFHVKKSATVVLYNKAGTYDYLRNQQYGIQISWTWNDATFKKTFTGMIIKTSTSERPGEETIELQCEDYMFILNNTPIINSPFYDGMVTFYAVKDLLKRAGIVNIVNDWDNTDEYFLPTGYAFTKPAVRFSTEQTLFECIMYIVQRPEAFIYFDENGIPHVKKLPGGLFSVGAGESTVESFTRDPTSIDKVVILDEKVLESDLSDTINRISILTLDRDTRNAIVYAISAEGAEDRLIYRRIYLQNQAALGEYAVAVDRAEELKKRMFFPIRKISFKTVGHESILKVLDFVQVDGQEFRIMSINRRFNANSNDFTQEYNAEWLGGA